MARVKGSMKLSNNIEPEIGAPLDARTIVRTKADLTNAKSYPFPYTGLVVTVQEDLSTWMLIDEDDPTNEDNWIPYGQGTVTKEELEVFATKEQLTEYATKEELQEVSEATPEIDLSDYAKKEDIIDDYEKLKNLPKINGVTLIGDKSFEDLGFSIDEQGDVSVEIKELEAPQISLTSGTSTLNYNGSPQGIKVDNLTESDITIVNGTNTNAGTYTAQIIPRGNNVWASSNDNTPIEYTYTIKKIDRYVRFKNVADDTFITNGTTSNYVLSNISDSVTYSYATYTGYYSSTIIENDDNPEVTTSITTTNTKDYISLSVQDNITTVTSLYENVAKVVIAYKFPATTNFNACTASMIISLKVKIVTWGGGSTTEVINMLNAARNGELNIYNYWAVGDERKMNISAIEKWSGLDYTYSNGSTYNDSSQSITWVLEDTLSRFTSSYRLKTAMPKGSRRPLFAVGMKNSLKGMMKMNVNLPTTFTWYSSNLRTWCNNNFKNALPNNVIDGIFRQTDVARDTTQSSSNDYFSVRCNSEVIGDYAFTYYDKNASRRKKSNGGNNSSAPTSGDRYFLRDPSDTSYYRVVYSDGTTGGINSATYSLYEYCGVSLLAFI